MNSYQLRFFLLEGYQYLLMIDNDAEQMAFIMVNDGELWADSGQK